MFCFAPFSPPQRTDPAKLRAIQVFRQFTAVTTKNFHKLQNAFADYRD
jgi:hypothetical protein